MSEGIPFNVPLKSCIRKRYIDYSSIPVCSSMASMSRIFHKYKTKKFVIQLLHGVDAI